MADIVRLIQQSGLDADVELVASIQEWCKEHNLPEDNPNRAGKIVKNLETGRYVILLPEVITDEMASSIRAAMEFRGFSEALAELADPVAFLRHLVLHEIAHGLDQDRSEEDCDRWAFQQLRALPSNSALVTDASASSLRASDGEPHRGR